MHKQLSITVIKDCVITDISEFRYRITFKLVVMVHRYLNRRAPQYLAVHCVPLTSHRHHLRSAERNLLHVPRHRLDTYSTRRAFAIAGLSAWNSLPDPVRNRNSTEPAFRRLLNTFLFARYQRTQHISVGSPLTRNI